MIVPFFPPLSGGGVYRPLSFVRYLPDHGWKTTVLSPRPEAFWIRDASLLRLVPDSCEVVRTGTLSGQRIIAAFKRSGSPSGQVRSGRKFAVLRKLGSFLLVPDTYIGWYPFAVSAGRKLMAGKSFDAIYSTSPPETSHLIARRLHEISGLPWIADFRDPWMNLHLYKPPTGLHAGLHRRLERKVIEEAGVVVTTRWHFEKIGSAGVDPGRLALIPNGYDESEMSEVGSVEPSGDVFTITHAGMLTQKRSAVPFLQALKIYLDRKPEVRSKLRVNFVGAREDDNERYMIRSGLQDVVEFKDGMTHFDTLKIERASHILLLIKHVDPAYKGMIPGKLYEYIGVRRPILALVPDGEVKDLVMGLRRGEIAPQEDAEGIAAVIEAMHEKFQRGKLDEEYDLTPREEYGRKARAHELAAFLDEMTKG